VREEETEKEKERERERKAKAMYFKFQQIFGLGRFNTYLLLVVNQRKTLKLNC
jgi:hypothetical protein